MNADVMIVRVNPGASTLGALNPGSIAGKFRKNVLKGVYSQTEITTRKVVKLVFGATGIASAPSRVLLVGRMLAGIFMVLAGFILGSQLGYAYHATAVFSVAVGMALIPGVATRLSMICATVWFFVAGFGMSLPGTIPGVEIILGSLSLVLAVTGPGRFSADAVMRKNIFKSLHRRSSRIGEQLRSSYKAYQYADMM